MNVKNHETKYVPDGEATTIRSLKKQIGDLEFKLGRRDEHIKRLKDRVKDCSNSIKSWSKKLEEESSAAYKRGYRDGKRDGNAF